MIEFMKSHYYDPYVAQYVHPKKEFKVKLKDADKEFVFDEAEADLNKLDKLIDEVEPGALRLPVLLKKYIKQNAKNISARFHRGTKTRPATQANPTSSTSPANSSAQRTQLAQPAQPPRAFTDRWKPGLAVTGTGSLPFFLRYPFPLKISTSSEEPRFFLRSRLLLKFSSS